MTRRMDPKRLHARAAIRADERAKVKSDKDKAVKEKSAHAGAFRLNNKVSWPIAAGAAVNIIVEGMRAGFDVDLSSMQADATLVAMAVVGYLVPSN